MFREQSEGGPASGVTATLGRANAEQLFPPGAVIDGKYRVDGVIAEGGMGVVVQATQMQLERLVAIKFLKPAMLSDARVVERFEREARLAAKIPSEHVVRVHDVGHHPTAGPYMVMELLYGQDLAGLLQHGPLQVPQAVDYLLQACDALTHAHAQRIVHRDLKPENLFLAESGGKPPVLKIIDFGISKVAPKRGENGAWTDTTELAVGTPVYMSPEQLEAAPDIDARSDVWSLGIILHELLTGQPPFGGDTVPQLCTAILSREPQPIAAVRADVPEALAAIVRRCLAKKPDERFASASELARALLPFGPARAHVVVGAEVAAAAAADAAPLLQNPGRAAPTVVLRRDPPRRTSLAILAIVAAVALLGAFVAIRRATRPPEAPSAAAAPSATTATAPPAVDVPEAIDLPAVPIPAAPVASASAVPSPSPRAAAKPRALPAVAPLPSPAPEPDSPRARFGERK
jgi:eukaryotic-like serine/threonine-protein kinase